MLLADVKPITNPVAEKMDTDPVLAFGKLISALIGLILVVATVWAFAQLMIGGINWISSSGDKGRLEIAQQKIMQSIIGLFIVFTSWAIFLVVLNFLGITSGENGINLILPQL